MTENKNAKELLERYLKNQCSNPEHVLVEHWYDNIQLQEAEDISGWAEASKERFRQQQAAMRRGRVIALARKCAAAAALLLFISATAIYLSGGFKGHSHTQTTTFSANTGPAGLRQLTLPDSTIVWLNANSSLEWTSEYGKGRRLVTLKGEASFEVRHNAAHPFVVHTPDADIKVLGTRFNVEAGTNTATQVALLRGKVAVSLNNAAGQHLELEPNEVAVCSVAGNQLRKSRTDVVPYFSWMNGGFYAEDMPLQDALEKLCTRFGYTVVWHNRRGSHKHISVSFPRQDFKIMLENLCYLNRLRYKMQDRNIIIQ